MKKIPAQLSIISLLALILLTACSSSKNDVSGDFAARTFTSFELSVPSSWSKIEKEEWANTIPEETVAVFAFKQENGFIRNANVIKEKLGSTATSIEYAKANILLGSRALFQYQKLNQEEMEIKGERTIFHTFLARNSSTDKLTHFTQSYFMKDSAGYTITCVAEDETSDAVSECATIVSSFRLR